MGVYTGISQDNATINSGRATLQRMRVTNDAPVTKTADFTVGDDENMLINNKSGSACVVTLPAAASWPGRRIVVKTIQAQAVNSASSNVVPRNSGTAGTAIVTGTAGNWAELVSNGTNWVIMAGS
jgi:hypothetical protein